MMIPISEPVIAKNASKYLSECLKTGWVSSAGDFVEEFEKKFAKFAGTKYAVATSSGTAALHLSLSSLRIGPGDEVILPAYTMIASLLPILYQGATPVLVDSELSTGNINVDLIEEKITKRTKAIMPVHMFGHPVDMDPLLKLAKKYHLSVVEDAAEAHGALYKNKHVGSLGTMGCFSFYGNKIITTGEGGMITTDNKSLAERARSLRNLARTPGKHFLHTELAYAYRMSNLQAALGLAELEEVTTYIKRKIDIAQKYNQIFSDIPDLILPQQAQYAKSVFWQYGIRVKDKKLLSQLEIYLSNQKIESRRFFVPMHMQPACKKEGLFIKEHYPVAEKLHETGLCLPSGIALTQKQQSTVMHALQKILS